jgi:hypothetical protein
MTHAAQPVDAKQALFLMACVCVLQEPPGLATFPPATSLSLADETRRAKGERTQRNADMIELISVADVDVHIGAASCRFVWFSTGRRVEIIKGAI